MFKAGSITGDIGLDRSPQARAFKESVKDAKAYKRDVERELNSIKMDPSRGFFNDAKAAFGKSSTFGQTLKFAAGGGAIAGLTFAAREVKQLADEVNELSNAFRRGEADAGDLTEKILEIIPVFGSFFQAGRSIREIFSGEKAEIEAINQAAKETQQIFDSQLASIRQHKQAMRDVAKEIRNIKRETENIGADSASSRKSDLEAAREAVKEQRAAEQAKQIKDAEDAAKPALDGLKKQRNEAQKGTEKITVRREDGGIEEIQVQSKQDRLDAENAARLLQSQQDSLEAKKRAIRASFAELEKADIEKHAKAVAELEKQIKKDKGKEVADAEEKRLHAAHEVTIQALKANGLEEEAAIQAIRNRVETAKTQNLKKVKEAEENFPTDPAHVAKIREQIEAQNRDLQIAADLEIKTFRKQRHDDIVDAIADPLRRYQKELKDINNQLTQGSISKDESAEAIKALKKRTAESLGITEEPLDEFHAKALQIKAALEKGIIDPQQAKAQITSLQEDLRRTMELELKPSQQEIRRFNFGELQAPKLATPLDNLLAVQKDVAADAKRTADAVEKTNTTIQSILDFKPAEAI